MTIAIKQGSKLSAKKAKELIFAMARIGNTYDVPMHTTLNIKDFYMSRGIKFDEVVEKVRNFGETVPFFENIIGSTWTSVGASVSVGGTKVVDGDGQYTTALYWSFTEQMLKFLQDATKNVSMPDLLSAVERGISSVEAYVGHRSEIWNRNNPDSELHDSNNKKIPFDSKIMDWIPIMTGGYGLDQGGRNWNDFVKLRRIRDSIAVHPKASPYGINNREFVDLANLTRTGASALLIDLHVLFNEKVPSCIIRHAYSPDYFIQR